MRYMNRKDREMAIQIAGRGNNFSGINNLNVNPKLPNQEIPKKMNIGISNTKKQNNGKSVFIIHGHNEAKWRELQSILWELNVKSIELSEQKGNGKTIIEKFEYFASQCQFAFAIFTYDDIVSKNGEEYLQVRPNVIFELGWFYAKLGREKVMIIEEKRENSNVFSDLSGIYRYMFHENVRELHKDIEDILREANILEA